MGIKPCYLPYDKGDVASSTGSFIDCGHDPICDSARVNETDCGISDLQYMQIRHRGQIIFLHKFAEKCTFIWLLSCPKKHSGK